MIDRSAVVLATQATGSSLAEVVELLEGDGLAVRQRITDRVAEIDARIATMAMAGERLALAHACVHEQILECPHLRSGVRSMLPDP